MKVSGRLRTSGGLKAPPTIWLVTTSYAPHVGGLQTLVAQLAAGLQVAGHSVRLFTQRSPRTLPAAEILHGLPVERWFFLLPQWGDLRRGRLDLVLAGLIFFPLTLARLLWRIGRARPAVIHAHFASEPALFVALARYIFPFRFVLTLHGDDVEGAPHRSGWGRWLFRFVTRRADVVTACSHYLLHQAQQLEPMLATKGRALHNGLRLPAASLAQPPGVGVVSVGRLMPVKGFDVLLQAMAQTTLESLWLVGEGPEMARLEQLAHTLGVAARVKFCGALSHAETLRALAASAFVVVPSRRDSFGLVALEAMAFGKPVVATQVGGLPEVLAGAEAVLVAPDDPTALAAALRQAQAELARDPQWGARNRAQAANFSLENMLAQYAAVYAGES